MKENYQNSHAQETGSNEVKFFKMTIVLPKGRLEFVLQTKLAAY